MKRGITKRFVLAGAVFAALQLGPDAAGVDMVFSSPVVTGSGVGQTALYSNIGTQEGVAIDMRATVAAQSDPSVSHRWLAEGDDFKFQFEEGENGETKYATVVYEFFESGTTNPLPIGEMALTVDDLDETSDRTEVLQVSGHTGYSLNSPTNVSVSTSGGVTIFTGGANQNTGDVEGAVTLQFLSQSTIAISYASERNETGSLSAFHHDGDGDFAFPTPEETTIGYEVNYTFYVDNEEDVPVKMDFTNTLPEGMSWDATFEPVTDIAVGDGSAAAFGAELQYAENGSGVSFSEIEVLPGVSSFTLKTIPTQLTGVVENTATTTPSANSGFPQVEMIATSIVDLGGGAGGRPPPETGPIPLNPPMASLTDGLTETTITLTNPNPAGSSTLYFVLVPVPSAVGCDIISGNVPPAGTFMPYSGPIVVPDGTYPDGFAVISYAVSEDLGWKDSGHSVAYDQADVMGLAGGHFDLDTTDGGTAGDDYDDTWSSWPGGGKVGQHTHEYDNKIGTSLIDMFNMDEGQSNVPDNVPAGVPFKIIVINASLSPKAHIAVNSDVSSASPNVTIYDNTAFELLPVYSLDGMPGTTQLTKLQIDFDDDAITGAGLLPTSSGTVKGNTPGKDGEWRNGALTIQIVRVNPDGTPIAPLDYAKSNGGHGVAPAGTMEHEVAVYWHWGGQDYDDAGNTYTPNAPPTVLGELDSSTIPVCDGL